MGGLGRGGESRTGMDKASACHADNYNAALALLLTPSGCIYQVASFMKARALVSSSSFALFRDGSGAFERAAAYQWRNFDLAGESLLGAEVSSGFFEILSARAAVGRTFFDSEEQVRFAVLSDSLWRRRYSGGPKYYRPRPGPERPTVHRDWSDASELLLPLPAGESVDTSRPSAPRCTHPRRHRAAKR